MEDMTLNTLYRHIKTRLQEFGIDTFALDARILICHAMQYTHEEFVLHGDDIVSHDHIQCIDNFVIQRLAGRPVAKIIGYKEFYGRNFKTTNDTLDPRPDSETLIDTVLTRLRSHNHQTDALRILDLGTGTGCLLLTLLAELPNALGVAVDQSAAALSVARENAQMLGLVSELESGFGIEDRVTFVQSDWLTQITGMFDVIISNPPYIPQGDIAGLAIDVREFDPYAALSGGADGLDPYRIIIPQLQKFLVPNGLAAFELGMGQADDVADMLRQSGFADVETSHDLARIGRVVSGIFGK